MDDPYLRKYLAHMAKLGSLVSRTEPRKESSRDAVVILIYECALLRLPLPDINIRMDNVIEVAWLVPGVTAYVYQTYACVFIRSLGNTEQKVMFSEADSMIFYRSLFALIKPYIQPAPSSDFIPFESYEDTSG